MGTRRARTGDSARDTARPRESQKNKMDKKGDGEEGMQGQMGMWIGKREEGRMGGIKNVLMSTNCDDGKRGDDQDA